MPPIGIYNFQMPKTTPTDGLKMWLFLVVYEARKGPPLWKLSKLDQLFGFLRKRWIFLGSNLLYPLTHSKWGKVTKNQHMYTHTHTRIRKYVMVGADLPPPGTNRVKPLWTVSGYFQFRKFPQTVSLFLGCFAAEAICPVLWGPTADNTVALLRALWGDIFDV